jgi:hypothetical protein
MIGSTGGETKNHVVPSHGFYIKSRTTVVRVLYDQK